VIFHSIVYYILNYLFQIFKQIKAEDKGKVKVFFCGAPALGKSVKEMSAKYSFSFSKENF
jgi:hypothetical protein